MDSFKLKLFAISTMLIDHIGVVLLSNTNHVQWYLICRAIGRLAFPIFAFLIVEGFLHTSNVKKYLIRLLAFAFVSEIPFDIALYKYLYGSDIISDVKYMFSDNTYISVVFNRLIHQQNVFFTLALGLLLITMFDMVDKKFIKKDYMDVVISNSLDAVLTAVICIAAYGLKTDYDIAGILIIVSFYLFRDSIVLMGISLFLISGTMLCQFVRFSHSGNLLDIVSILATLAIIPISLYNGKKGKNVKYIFYAFYPVHLLCLFLISLLL